jgi:hypothetical protein
MVAAALAGWRYPAKLARTRHDDEAILALLRSHWGAGGCSLRRLRDEFNVACEQGRYLKLARRIRGEKAYGA